MFAASPAWWKKYPQAGADLGVGEGKQPPTLSLPLPTLMPIHRFSPNEDI